MAQDAGATDTIWYGSARLFRQPKIGDWGSIFAKVDRELRGMVAAPAA